MNHRISRRVVAGLATGVSALCLLGAGGPASAQEYVRRDAPGDLSRVGEDSDLFVPLPGRHYPDVTRVRFAHRAGQLVVRASFIDLAPAGHFLFGGVQTRTPDGRRFFTVMATKGSRDGFLFKDTDRPCPVDIRSDYADDVMRVAVPRSCLGDPRWVQVRFGASVLQRDGDEIIDNAGAPRYTDRAPFPWSPRLRRD